MTLVEETGYRRELYLPQTRLYIFNFISHLWKFAAHTHTHTHSRTHLTLRYYN